MTTHARGLRQRTQPGDVIQHHTETQSVLGERVLFRERLNHDLVVADTARDLGREFRGGEGQTGVNFLAHNAAQERVFFVQRWIHAPGQEVPESHRVDLKRRYFTNRDTLS